jgi:hypothetical protein
MPAVIPQPLTGEEIRQGIAVRMTADVREECVAAMRKEIVAGLGRTCSLTIASCYSKFSAEWNLTYWEKGELIGSNWWVDGKLDDFGRITPFSIGSRGHEPGEGYVTLTGKIEETPPDKFRRETAQPIPKPVELKKPEQEMNSFSKSVRGTGKRRDV